MLIQACQESATFQTQFGEDTDPLPVQKGDQYKNQHISLRRDNTVLLLSTVREGKALRGAFSGAMADQFRSANGKKEIHEMFAAASKHMPRTEATKDQKPEFRSVLKQRIILPPAATPQDAAQPAEEAVPQGYRDDDLD